MTVKNTAADLVVHLSEDAAPTAGVSMTTEGESRGVLSLRLGPITIYVFGSRAQLDALANEVEKAVFGETMEARGWMNGGGW